MSDNAPVVHVTETELKPKPAPEAPKYKHLTKNFFRGSFAGQLVSIYRDKDKKPEKLKDFRKALKDKDVPFDEEITRAQADKLKELHIPLPSHVKIKGAPVRAKAAQLAA